MKYYYLAAALLLAAPAAHAQDKGKDAPLVLPMDTDTKQIAYTGVIELPGATKNELYARGKVWFANAFKSAQNVIQADDKEAGLLVGKGFAQQYITLVLMPSSEKVWFTVKLAFKDGKYRYSITDFMFEGEPSKYNSYHPSAYPAERYMQTKKDGSPTNLAAKWAKALDETAQSEIASLQAGMTKAATGSDW